MTDTIIYISRGYDISRVTGRYVRCHGQKGNYRFRVFETATDKNGRPGMGYTLKEYDTKGDDLPKELKKLCIATKTTQKWETTK